MSKALELIRTLIDGANEYEKKTGNKNPTVYLSKNNLLVIEKSLLKAQEPKHYLKWEDLEFKEKAIYKRVVLNGELYLLKTYRNFILDFDIVEIEKTDGTILLHINQHSLQFFNDLKLEVEEWQD